MCDNVVTIGATVEASSFKEVIAFVSSAGVEKDITDFEDSVLSPIVVIVEESYVKVLFLVITDNVGTLVSNEFECVNIVDITVCSLIAG